MVNQIEQYEDHSGSALRSGDDFNPVDEQRSDESGAWIDASAFVKDFGNDHYEVVVWLRGACLNHFETRLDENGETRIYPHWLKSRGGKRVTREDLAGENFSEQTIRYNTVSGEIQPR